METMEMKEVAETTEALIGKVLRATRANEFTLEGAIIFGVENGEVFTLGTHPDIYSLLEDEMVRLTAKTYDYTAVVTTGWAAPLAADGTVDGMPSQHAERRRVRLTVVANADGVVSVLRFEDDANEVVVDEGSATGSLNDAIRSFVA